MYALRFISVNNFMITIIYNLYDGRTIIFLMGGGGGGGWGLENFENKLYASKKQFLQKDVDTKKLFAAGAVCKKKNVCT